MSLPHALVLAPWIFVWIVLLVGIVVAIVQIFRRPTVGIALAVAVVGIFAVSVGRIISSIVMDYSTLAALLHLGMSFLEALFLAVFVFAIVAGRGKGHQ